MEFPHTSPIVYQKDTIEMQDAFHWCQILVVKVASKLLLSLDKTQLAQSYYNYY